MNDQIKFGYPVDPEVFPKMKSLEVDTPELAAEIEHRWNFYEPVRECARQILENWAADDIGKHVELLYKLGALCGVRAEGVDHGQTAMSVVADEIVPQGGVEGRNTFMEELHRQIHENGKMEVHDTDKGSGQ